MGRQRVLAFTQGDPAGVGPELLLKLIASWTPQAAWRPLLIAEQSVLASVQLVPAAKWDLVAIGTRTERLPLDLESDAIPIVEPDAPAREVRFGSPSVEDARASLAAIDLGLECVRRGLAEALITCPINKQSIASSVDSSFRGHTDHLAGRCGLERYGRDYLMAFLGRELRVALLSTHVPLRQAVEQLNTDLVVDALVCLDRAVQRQFGQELGGNGRSVAGRRIALAGLNPHAGEGGLLGGEEIAVLQPAVERARALGVNVVGPESPDTVFWRCRRGEFDWVMALYHDQGLIAVKTLGFGGATNWTAGLPIVRTSVDHGTGYDIAGRGMADVSPLQEVVETTLSLLDR